MTKSYVQLSLVISKLILAKVIHVCNFIKDVLYHGGSTYKFVNFSQFLENLWAGSGYRAFELCAFIIMLTVLSVLYFQNFENVENLPKLTVDKLGEKCRNEVRSLEIRPIPFAKRSRMKLIICLLPSLLSVALHVTFKIIKFSLSSKSIKKHISLLNKLELLKHLRILRTLKQSFTGVDKHTFVGSV